MVTFLCCLIWKLEYGIIVGAAVQCVFILYNSARPNIRIETYKVGMVQIVTNLLIYFKFAFAHAYVFVFLMKSHHIY